MHCLKLTRHFLRKMYLPLTLSLFLVASPVLAFATPNPGFQPTAPNLGIPDNIQHLWANFAPYFNSGKYPVVPPGCQIDQVRFSLSLRVSISVFIRNRTRLTLWVFPSLQSDTSVQAATLVTGRKARREISYRKQWSRDPGICSEASICSNFQ